MVAMMHLHHTRAKPCKTRSLLPNQEAGIEMKPRTTVYAQISGSKIKYERSRLAQPCFLGSTERRAPSPVQPACRSTMGVGGVSGVLLSSFSPTDAFSSGTQILVPSRRMASPTMYMEPVITTTPRG